jgi:hypothetical protein
MWRATIALLAALASGPAAAADRIVLDGVVFAAEHGGLRLVDGWGRGSRDEPFVLVEEITADGAAVLTVREAATRFGRPVAGGIGVGFVLKKIVTNRTAQPWTIFEMELRQDLVAPSDYWDGLSFHQAGDRTPYVTSDRFGVVDLADEPADRLAFSAATVAPGETVVVQVAVTDHSPVSPFFLIQRRDAPLAGLAPGYPEGDPTCAC